MVKAVLTDLDGVVRVWTEHPDPTAETDNGLPRGSISEVAFTEEMMTAVTTGQISDDRWRQRMIEKLQERFPQADAEEAVARWSVYRGTVDAEVLRLLRRCREEVPLTLVTNATTRLDADLDHLGLSDEFDHIVNSSELGRAKPAPKIYSAALDASGIEPDQAVFIDDTAANVEGARQVGIVGHNFEGTEGLRERLAALNLL